MAKMWPRVIPPEIQNHPLRETECRVYDHLQKKLDDTYVVFYSRPWLGQTSTGEEIDGECDFVVAHPEHGFLAIEVKGGGVSYDPEIDRWKTRNRYGIQVSIKNPVSQARTSKYQLLKKLQESPAWDSRRIPAIHGVILPDVVGSNQDLGTDMPPEIFCFLEEFEHNLRGWVEDRFETARAGYYYQKSLGEDGIAALETLLAHPFTLHVPLGNILAGDERSISTFTQDQYQIMELIGAVRFAAISGGAGTGKTILALEEAIRRAESGASVLFTCYNRALAIEASRRTDGIPGLTVGTFHDICTRFARKAGISLPVADNHPQNYYDEVLPDALIRAFTHLPKLRFDAIIVDEGQDFQRLWFEALIQGLRSPEETSVFRIFYDNNQRLYGNRTSIPSDFEIIPVTLRYNLRNTRRIHRVVQRHYQGPPVSVKGPEGVEVEWVPAGDITAIRRCVNQKVADLVEIERVLPENIAVLTESDGMNAAMAPTGIIGGQRLRKCDRPDMDGVVVDTVRRFKGLESQVVILALTGGIVSSDELMYVALSRARSYLTIIGEDKNLEIIRRDEE